jgi:uncharacterized SAM-binding protein YcdF (DUF218 family)
MLKIISLLLAIILFWASGLVWFIYQIPHKDFQNENAKTDAVIALTGGVDRVEESIQLLLNNNAAKLFISGVGSPKHLRNNLKIHNLNDKTIFGTTAKSTYENAQDVSLWVKEHKLNSIRLVTANYHMPRASMLIRALNPGLTIVQHPVFPKAFNLKKWRKSPLTIKLLFFEYNKYLALRLSLLFNGNL